MKNGEKGQPSRSHKKSSPTLVYLCFKRRQNKKRPSFRSSVYDCTMTDMDDHCNRTSTGPGKLDELMINIEAALIVPVLVGNLLIMASVIAFRNMKTAGNILICNLALADFLVGALYLPFDIWFMVHSRTSVTSVTCSWRTSLWDSLLGTSVLNLTLISFDRFTAVCHPFYYYLVTVDRVLSACVVAWCPMTVMSFMPMFGWNRWELCPKPAKCNQRYTHTAELRYTQFGVLAVLLVLNSCLMAVIMREVSRQMNITRFRQTIIGRFVSDKPETMDAYKKQIKIIKQELRKSKSIVTMYVLFLCCWLPYLTGVVLDLFCPWSKEVLYVVEMGRCIAISNTCLNAFVYGYSKQDFRKAFKRLLLLHHLHDSSPQNSVIVEYVGNVSEGNVEETKGFEETAGLD